MADKLLRAIKEKRPAIGCIDVTTGWEYMEMMGYVGMDFVYLDQMFTGLDWDRAAQLIRASATFGMSPIIRVAAYPWTTGPIDPRLAVDTARAFSLCASAVSMSVSSAKEVEQCIHVQEQGWHRRPHIMPFQKSNWEQREASIPDLGLVIPLLESQGAVRELEGIVSVDGLKCVFLGWTDMSKMLGHPFDYEHPEVWKFVDKLANLCAKKGVTFMANVGYEYRTIDEMAARAKRMYDRGVQIIALQNASVLLQFMLQDLLKKTRELIPISATGGGAV